MRPAPEARRALEPDVTGLFLAGPMTRRAGPSSGDGGRQTVRTATNASSLDPDGAPGGARLQAPPRMTRWIGCDWSEG